MSSIDAILLGTGDGDLAVAVGLLAPMSLAMGMPFALGMRAVLRVPLETETRGNIHVGGQCVKTEVSERDRESIAG